MSSDGSGTNIEAHRDWHYQKAAIQFEKASDKWPGGFSSGEEVYGGQFGDGIVASHAYCMGTCPSQKDRIVDNAGTRAGLVPILYPQYGCWWVPPDYIRRRG